MDIGCGNAYFLSEMQKFGWEVYGNDLSASGCNFAKEKLGLKNIYNADLKSIDFPEKYFDVITMWHTLEHMKFPKEILEKINLILKDNGTLIIEVPNYRSFQPWFFKDKCYSVDLPRHLYQFTPLTLHKLLKKTGFSVYSKRNLLVDLHINFISFKLSFMRWLGIVKPPVEGVSDKPLSVEKLRYLNMFWIFARTLFNLICLCLSFLTSLVMKDLCLRVYCRKTQKL